MFVTEFFQKVLKKKEVKKKRKEWSQGPKRSKEQLRQTLLNPDPDLLDLILEAYLKKVVGILEILLPVYSNGTYPLEVKEQLALHFLVIAKDPLAGKKYNYYLGHNGDWTNPDKGRLVHVIRVGKALPHLQKRIEKEVISSFSDMERARFFELHPW